MNINIDITQIFIGYITNTINMTSVSIVIYLIYIISNNLIFTAIFCILFSGGAVDSAIVSILQIFNSDTIINIFIRDVSIYYKIYNYNVLPQISTILIIGAMIIISGKVIKSKDRII